MKVLVLGANGRTGSPVVDQAMANGHEVSALVRHAGRFPRPGLREITGDALNAKDVLVAVDGQDAVVQCIGGSAPWRRQRLERDAMRHILTAMGRTQARRLLVVSAMGVDESAMQSPWWYRWLLVPTFLRGSTEDKSSMEAMVRASAVNWTIARPPVLTNGSATGKVRVLGRRETGHAISRADLAGWLVAQLDSAEYVGQAAVVVSR